MFGEYDMPRKFDRESLMERTRRASLAEAWGLTVREKQAGKTPLVESTVKQFRRDFLTLMKNASRINRDKALLDRWRSASRQWNERFKGFGSQVRDDLEGRIRVNKGKPSYEQSINIDWAQYYIDNMDPFWNFTWEFGQLPSLDSKKAESREEHIERMMAHPSAEREGWTEESLGDWYDKSVRKGWLKTKSSLMRLPGRSGKRRPESGPTEPSPRLALLGST